MICPYGFWGFAHVIEEPPSVELGDKGRARDQRRSAPRQRRGREESRSQHRADEQPSPGAEGCLATFDLVDCDSRDQVSAALSGAAAVQLVYFYCHGLRREAEGLEWPALGVGHKEVILPGDLGAWATGWPEDHWATTSPLVVINGCHTVEVAPDSIANFVDALAGCAPRGS